VGKAAAYCKVYGHSAVSRAKTAKTMEMSFGTWTWVGPKNHVLGGGALWWNLANMNEPDCVLGDVRRCGLMPYYSDHLFVITSCCRL